MKNTCDSKSDLKCDDDLVEQFVTALLEAMKRTARNRMAAKGGYPFLKCYIACLLYSESMDNPLKSDDVLSVELWDYPNI